ncbi:MAG: KpsF/GutQ family sugar-phosphate isomerase [Deferribacteres bacterium]|nr:KpsF/GutQ family sugar-phosphate isomerase [Deferribacteres bacterium]
MIKEGRRVVEIEAREVSKLKERIGEEFAKAVEILFECKGRVVLTGMGKSGIIAKKIAATMASTGTPAFFLHPAEGVHGDLGMLTRGDVVIALSNSGKTREILDIIPVVKRLGLKLIALTGNVNSELARKSDVVLDVSVAQEACPLGLAPTSSTTVSLVMGDALAMALLKKKGFKRDDFALVHPAGSLGKRLTLKVEDLMHEGDEIPAVKEETPMKDVVIEISSKRLGMAVVVDEDFKLKGIITDGDLRRFIEKFGKAMFDAKAKELMTKDPKVIKRDALAVEALNIMEKYSITSLVVVDENNRVEGIIHLHDILKAGVV